MNRGRWIQCDVPIFGERLSPESDKPASFGHCVREAKNTVGDGIAMQNIVEQPAIQLLLLQRLLNFLDIQHKIQPVR